MHYSRHSYFPDPSEADDDGFLCSGGSYSIDILIDAYTRGIFPWPQEDLPVLWFSPPERGILEFNNLHIPKSLKRFKSSWKGEFRINTSFREVMENCRKAVRPGQMGTWITEEMIDGYCSLHKAGFAHSVEAWEKGHLVAGIYGVYVNNVFSAESMFYKKPNCSKLCLWFLADRLSSIGLEWMDIQMLTPVTESMGGTYVSRDRYLNMLKEQKLKTAVPFR